MIQDKGKNSVEMLLGNSRSVVYLRSNEWKLANRKILKNRNSCNKNITISF